MFDGEREICWTRVVNQQDGKPLITTKGYVVGIITSGRHRWSSLEKEVVFMVVPYTMIHGRFRLGGIHASSVENLIKS